MNWGIIAFDVAMRLGVVLPLAALAWNTYRLLYDRDTMHRPRDSAANLSSRWYDEAPHFVLLPLGTAIWSSWFRIVSPVFPCAYETGRYYIFLVPAAGIILGYPWFHLLRARLLFPATDTEPGKHILRQANRSAGFYVLFAFLGTLLVSVLLDQFKLPEV